MTSDTQANQSQALVATRVLSVKEIMVPNAAFIRARSARDAKRVFREYADIDMLPIPNTGEPTHTIFRDQSSVHKIPRSMLISESTPIIELAKLFHESHDGFFVLGGRSIVGLVHFSDLNHPLCKVPYFAIMESLEGLLLERIPRDEFTLEGVTALLGRDRARSIFKRADKLKEMLPSSAAAMYFGDLLLYLSKRGIIVLDAAETKLLNEFRNRLYHAGRRLIMRPPDKALIVRAEQLCLRLLAS